jgi:hypothetical protein
MEPLALVTSPKREISLPREALIVICFFGEAHSLRIVENPSKIKACAKVAIESISAPCPRLNSA